MASFRELHEVSDGRNYPNALGWDTTVVDAGNREEKYRYDRDGVVLG